MIWKDEIVAEIRKIREEHAKAFDYDIIAMGRALMEEENKSDRKFTAPPNLKKIEAK